jgi:predicted DsbA family dithiol-disulfide isomerase
MIDPGTNPNGEEFEAYNRRRWGSSSWTIDLKRQGARDGAAFANWQWWPNTSKAHQFIQYGKEKNSGGFDTNHANAVLFDALYEQGENISTMDTLVALAAREYPNWNTNNDLRTYLEQDQGLRVVQQEIRDGRQKYGISGVPYFVISSSATDNNSKNKPYGFSGAQSSSTFVEIFEKLVNG